MASERRLRWPWAAGFAVWVASGAALAGEPTAADREMARSLMDEGKTRLAHGDAEGALKAYKGADAIMHVPTTGIAVARTQASMGLLVDAYDTAFRVARIPVAAREPKVFAEARSAAEELDQQLLPRIPTLKIELKGPGASASPEVAIDGDRVPADALLVPRKVNPGHHVVAAKVGGEEKRAEVDVVERDTKTVTLELPAPATAAAPPPASAGSSATPPPAPVVAPPPAPGRDTSPREPKRSVSPLVWVGAGLGVAGLAVGSVAGGMSISRAGRLSSGCQNYQCPPAAYGDLDAARTWATVSTIGFAAAGAGVVVAVVGLLVGGSSSRAAGENASKSVVLWVDVNGVGAAGAF